MIFIFQDLEEQRGLLSEAARALQVQEERCRGRVEQVQEQLRVAGLERVPVGGGVPVLHLRGGAGGAPGEE